MPTGTNEQAVFLINLFHWQVFKIINSCQIHKGEIKGFAIDNDLDHILMNAFLRSKTVE